MKDRSWVKLFRNYYQHDLSRLYEYFIANSRSVLFLDKSQFSGNKIKLPIKTTYEYVVISDALGVIYDIQDCFNVIKGVCRPETRLIFNFQNFMWQPFLDLAELIGLKSKQPRVNWLTREDIYNLLRLEGFEIIKTGKRFLFPFPMDKVSDFINRYIIYLPLINNFCLTNYVIAKLNGSDFKTQPSVSIIVPARNEEENIEPVIRAFLKLTPYLELIFVEGHSKDNTWEEIKKMQLKYKSIKILAAKQQGIGKADAVRKGFSLAKNDVLMIWDADLTVSPNDFDKFYEPIASGKGEFIFGSRLVYPLEKESMRLLNILGNKIFSWVFSWLIGQPIKDTLCGTKAISRKNYLKLMKNRKYFGNYDPFGDFDLIFGAAKINLKFVEIPVRYLARTYGESNISRFSHGWLLLKMVFIALNKLKFI